MFLTSSDQLQWSGAGVLLQGPGVQQSGVAVLGKQPEILSLPFSKNWARHSAPKACAKEAKEVYNAVDLKCSTSTPFPTGKKSQTQTLVEGMLQLQVCCLLCWALPDTFERKDNVQMGFSLPSWDNLWKQRVKSWKNNSCLRELRLSLFTQYI